MSEFLPPVVGKLLGDARQFRQEMDGAKDHYAATTGDMENRGAAMKAKVGAGLAAVGGLATGAGAVLEHMGHGLEVAEGSLDVAIKNSGSSMEHYQGQIDGVIKTQEHYGHSSTDTDNALAILTRATGNAGQSIKDMSLVTELAAAHHTDLATAANVVAKMHAGAYRPLKEFGINVKDNADAVKSLTKAKDDFQKANDAHDAALKKYNDLLEVQHGKHTLTIADHQHLRDAKENLTNSEDMLRDAQATMNGELAKGATAMDFNKASALVMAKVHGTAAAQADTFGGKIAFLKTKAEDWAASIGTKVGPALTMLGPLLVGISGLMSTSLVPAIASATLAALPWIAAIGAVVVAGYLLYNNWSTIVEFLKGIVLGAWHFIHDHFTQIASFVFLPVAPLIALGSHFGEVLHGIEGVARTVWGTVEGLFKTGINGIITAVNFFIRMIDKVQIHIPSIGFGPIHTPGFDWGGLRIPEIPKLAKGTAGVTAAGFFDVAEAGTGGERIFLPGGAAAAPMNAMGGGDTYVVNVNGPVFGGDKRAIAQELIREIRTEMIRSGGRQSLGLPN